MDGNDSIQVISEKKLVCYSPLYMIFSDGNRLYIKKTGCEEYRLIECLPLSGKYGFLSNARLMQRFLRIEPRCGVFIDDHRALISMNGSVLRISGLDFSVIKEHSFRSGMNNPLTFCSIKDIRGFENGIYYGEYFDNRNREQVSIYHRNDEGVWRKVYAFKMGQVHHIHRIFAHEQRQSLFVLTGDTDEESAIWECRDNFDSVKKIAGGRQIYRSCVAFPIDNGIIYATDTPLEQNSIYKLRIDKEGITCRRLLDINGPCIYGTQDAKGTMFFSTSVEPDSRLRPYIRYVLSCNPGPGVNDKYSHIYGGNASEGIREIYREKKDRFPMALFGFGTFLFPDGCDREVYVTGQGLENIDGRTLSL